MANILKKNHRVIFSSIFLVLILLCSSSLSLSAEQVPIDRLNSFAKEMLDKRAVSVGYPCNQNTDLKEFYEWYLNSHLYETVMNNVGDPEKPSSYPLNTREFENEVISFFAPLYGFPRMRLGGLSRLAAPTAITTGCISGLNSFWGKPR